MYPHNSQKSELQDLGAVLRGKAKTKSGSTELRAQPFQITHLKRATLSGYVSYGMLLNKTLALFNQPQLVYITHQKSFIFRECLNVFKLNYISTVYQCPSITCITEFFLVLMLTLRDLCIWIPNPGDIFLPHSFHRRWEPDFINFKVPPYRPGNPNDLKSNCEAGLI